MPTFEQTSSVRNASESHGSSSYDKILAIFNRQSGGNTASSRNFKSTVSLKTSVSYEASLQTMTDDDFKNAAGADLSTLFMPFETKISGSGYPRFHETVNPSGTVASGVAESGVGVSPPKFTHLLPFQWDLYDNTTILDRWQNPSGDGLANVISGPSYYGDSNRYRDLSDTRSVGLRLPMMGVGWGYTTSDQPWPSGGRAEESGVFFKGGHERGWEVDPADYVAAPLDFRYDMRRHVWTAGGQGFWAEVTDMEAVTYTDVSGFPSGVIVPYYSWIEKDVHPSGYMVNIDNARRGDRFRFPAHEVNYNIDVPSGTHVWLVPHPQGDRYSFVWPSVTLPTAQYQHMAYYMVSQHQSGWDFLRAHPVL